MKNISRRKLGWYALIGLMLSLNQRIDAKTTTIDQNFLKTALSQYYPVFNKVNNCQGVWTNSGAYDGVTNTPYKIGYCIKVDAQKIVTTSTGKRLYVITVGDVSFNEIGEKAYGGHVHSGLVGMFVFRQQGSNWVVESANPYMNAGSSGNGLTEWKFMKLAPEKWGFINEHGDTHFGVSGTDYVILTPNGKTIQQSWIGSSFSEGGREDCAEKKNFKNCMELSTNYTIDTSKTVDGFYSITILLNGHDGGKIYKNKPYKIFYDAKKGYQEPKNYPLSNLEF